MKNRIRELRAERNIPQWKLAKAIGVSVNTISSWERQLTEPTQEQLEEIATFFKVSIRYLTHRKYRLYLIENTYDENIERILIGSFEQAVEIAKQCVGNDLANQPQPEDILISCYENTTFENLWDSHSFQGITSLADVLKDRQDED